MSDRKLHSEAYREWKEQRTDEYVQAQRRAFLDGFETAAKESEEFNLLRRWLEEQRDIAGEKYEKSGDDDFFVRRLAFIEVLVKLSEMGCMPDVDDNE